MTDIVIADNIGENIRIFRKSRGYSQEEVAKLLGLSKQAISFYERGDRKKLSLDKVPSLCRLLGISPNDLFGWQESQSINGKGEFSRAERVMNETPTMTIYGRDEWRKFSKRRSASTASGYVYLVQVGDFVKIGKTIFPYGRITGLKITFENYGNSKIGLCAISEEHQNYTENEKILHKYFAKERIPKSELFKVDFDRAMREIQNGWTGIKIS